MAGEGEGRLLLKRGGDKQAGRKVLVAVWELGDNMVGCKQGIREGGMN